MLVLVRGNISMHEIFVQFHGNSQSCLYLLHSHDLIYLFSWRCWTGYSYFMWQGALTTESGPGFCFFPYFSKNALWDFVLTLLYYSWHDHKNGKGLQSLSITSSSRRLSLVLLIAPPTGFDNHTKAVASLQDRNKFWSNSTTVFRYCIDQIKDCRLACWSLRFLYLYI